MGQWGMLRHPEGEETDTCENQKQWRDAVSRCGGVELPQESWPEEWSKVETPWPHSPSSPSLSSADDSHWPDPTWSHPEKESRKFQSGQTPRSIINITTKHRMHLKANKAWPAYRWTWHHSKNILATIAILILNGQLKNIMLDCRTDPLAIKQEHSFHEPDYSETPDGQ